MGTLLSRSSSNSNSFICLSRTARYSLSRKSCSTSCQRRTFSPRRATLTLARRVTTIHGGNQMRHSLAAYEGHDTREVSCSCTTLRPHPYKELSGQRMHPLKIEEERLERCRGGILKKVRKHRVSFCSFSTYIQEQIWPNVLRAILQLHWMP